jgi:hypothetical protein
MKRALIVGLILISSTALADCYTRSNIRIARQVIDAGPTDVQRLVVPDARGHKCVVRYRVNIGGDWQTAEGSAVATTEAEACARALDITRGTVLAEIEPTTIRADMQMVCSDLPDIRVRPVRIGETIWESETDLHSIPQERKYFWYKRTKCRLFQERDPRDRNLIVYQGVVCQADGTPNSKWRVIDKF